MTDRSRDLSIIVSILESFGLFDLLAFRSTRPSNYSLEIVSPPPAIVQEIAFAVEQKVICRAKFSGARIDSFYHFGIERFFRATQALGKTLSEAEALP
jgi:hypothetical protein